MHSLLLDASSSLSILDTTIIVRSTYFIINGDQNIPDEKCQCSKQAARSFLGLHQVCEAELIDRQYHVHVHDSEPLAGPPPARLLCLDGRKISEGVRWWSSVQGVEHTISRRRLSLGSQQCTAIPQAGWI